MNLAFYRFSRVLTYLYFKIYNRTSFRNQHLVPKNCPLIVPSNHCSHLDPPILASLLMKRPITFMAKKELFDQKLFGLLITNLGAFPVDRGASADKKAFVETIRLLKEQRAVVIFPEGTRSSDGKLQKFQIGAARLAMTVENCRILPVKIDGSFKSLGGRSKFPKPCKISVRAGEPLDPSDFMSITDKKQRTEAITEELRKSISAL